MKRWLFRLTMLVLALLAAELAVRVAARAGWVRVRTFRTADRVNRNRFIGDINPHFGVWHPSNATVAVETPAGKLTYETNEHGMRDRPRAIDSDAAERVVVLGDSFTEGYYVSTADRFTDVLERRTGVEFLNFGVSGSFGSIQEWLLYEHLARRFDHTGVFIFFLPDNDFKDNDPRRNPADRYRPYLRDVPAGHEVVYPVAFNASGRSLRKLSRGRKLRHRVYNKCFTLNILASMEWSALKNRVPVSSYDDYAPDDLEHLLYTYERILELAAPRPVTVFIIPRDKDFVAHANGRFEGRITEALRAFAERHDRLKVVDLMPGFLDHMKEHGVSHEAFFLAFDPHWSPLGHEVAADIVQASLSSDF